MKLNSKFDSQLILASRYSHFGSCTFLKRVTVASSNICDYSINAAGVMLVTLTCSDVEIHVSIIHYGLQSAFQSFGKRPRSCNFERFFDAATVTARFSLPSMTRTFSHTRLYATNRRIPSLSYICNREKIQSDSQDFLFK